MNRQIPPIECLALARQANDARATLAAPPHPGRCFLVQARFVGRMPFRIASLAQDNDLYLGRRGQWCSRAKALRFRTRAAAERALHDKWIRLRDAGNRSVILSIIQPLTCIAQSSH